MKCNVCRKNYMTAQQFQRHACVRDAGALSVEALADKLIATGGAGKLTREQLLRQLTPKSFDPTAGAGQDMRDAIHMRSYR